MFVSVIYVRVRVVGAVAQKEFLLLFVGESVQLKLENASSSRPEWSFVLSTGCEEETVETIHGS